MSKAPLDRLRGLRDRAKVLSDGLIRDLRPFVKADGTFRRKPNSRSVANDVGVTTTCSCLMALALTESFQEFYNEGKTQPPQDKASELLRILFSAPWMSSGLTDNNAFTTSLVLRAYGFLCGQGLGIDQHDISRPWELALELLHPDDTAARLHNCSDATSQFLWCSLTDSIRDGIAKSISTHESIGSKLSHDLALDIRRILEGGWIYADNRFDKVSEETKAALAVGPTGYTLVRLNRHLLSEQYSEEIPKPPDRTITEIVEALGSDPKNFAINSYPPSAAVVYWFVDGISRAKIRLPETHWTKLCLWATQEFNRKRSLVAASHDALMDPVSMGMAACLCARLRALCDASEPNTNDTHQSYLPSAIELNHSIGQLLREQTRSGIWHKYFPLFHYQDAGSNFCFAFELLEALLCEFGQPENTLTDDHAFLGALENAVTWCETNRYVCTESGTDYTGWNSGGQIETLERRQPESWATAVVHMFLFELQVVLARKIQQGILAKYRTSKPKATKKSDDSGSAIAKMLDIEIALPSGTVRLSHLLKTKLIDTHQGQTEASLRRHPSKGPLSALLFGPPGTSKTQLTKSIASDLAWPLLEITPSDFVGEGLENVYVRANEIFQDLMDLSGTVVFFDEMDALVQTRADGHLDIASQFLTTMMLPKLTQLHDHGRVVFFMATNFQDRFDPAIKRAGRFDLLLCMGPPCTDEKLNKLELFFGGNTNDEISTARASINEFLGESDELKDRFELLTFGELQSFLKGFGPASNIGSRIRDLGQKEFAKRLTSYCKYATLRMEDLSLVESDILTLEKAYDRSFKDIEEKKKAPIVRYLIDRKESREQY